MEDCQKRWQAPNSNDSVIARMMGFDELCRHQPFREKRSVLSESYVRNAASVGVRPGSLVANGRSCSKKNEIVHEVKGTHVVNASICKVKKGHVLRYLQKHDHLGIDDVNKSLEFESGVIDEARLFSTGISVLKPKTDFEDVKLDRHSRRRYGKQRKFFKCEIGKDHYRLAHKEPVVNGIVSCRHSCIGCTRAMSRFCRKETPRSKIYELLRTGYMGDKYIVNEVEMLSAPGVNDSKNHSRESHLLLDKSSLDNESRKQNIEKWRTAKEVREDGAYESQKNLDGMLSLADDNSGYSSPSIYSFIDPGEDSNLESLPVFDFEAMKETISSGWTVKQDESAEKDNKSKEQTISLKGIVELKGGRGCQLYPGVNDTLSPSSNISESSSSYFSSIGEAYVQVVQDELDYGSENERFKVTKLCATIDGDPQSESNPGILSKETELFENGHSSYVQEVSGEEASLNEYSEEESSYSNCSRITPPDFQDNLKRTYQQSPDSVLESFDMQNFSTFEHFDSIGLQLQLEALNFDPEETYSEGSVMVVSGDEEFDERFDILSHDGRKVKMWLGENKSMNFSYMVDVLDEAEFCGMKSFTDFKTWYSLECPISPSVFEALEKKYCKQVSWQKSERRLLFERINAGLISIFNPFVKLHDCATSIRSRMCASLRRDEVEDELWMMLISQEKEKNKDSSEKAFEKWFEEGVNIICSELEASLFDDLAMELASFWIFDE